MIVNAYLNFNGNCREALEFYVKAFDAKMPEMMLFGVVWLFNHSDE